MQPAAQAVFAALAHDTRLRSLMLLQRHGELCVCELTQALGVSQPHISRHLALLRETGLVVDRRVGTWVFYRLNPPLPVWVSRVLAETARGATGQAPSLTTSAPSQGWRIGRASRAAGERRGAAAGRRAVAESSRDIFGRPYILKLVCTRCPDPGAPRRTTQTCSRSSAT
jgi:DNA-binding transcriptional ArsR family regulator